MAVVIERVPKLPGKELESSRVSMLIIFDVWQFPKRDFDVLGRSDHVRIIRIQLIRGNGPKNILITEFAINELKFLRFELLDDDVLPDVLRPLSLGGCVNFLESHNIIEL